MDYENNGLVVQRHGKRVVIELIDKGKLQSSVRIGDYATEAIAEAVRILASLKCAAFTAAITMAEMSEADTAISECMEALGASDESLTGSLCISFKVDLEPIYEFCFVDTARQGVVSGCVGQYAEMVHRPTDETTDKSGGEAR